MALPPLTRRDLDAMPCHCCGEVGHRSEDPMVLSPRCHRGRGARALYIDGVLTLECAACSKVVARIQVAAQPLEPVN